MNFDQVDITYIPPEVYDRVMEILNDPPKDTPKLDKLMATKPPWSED